MCLWERCGWHRDRAIVYDENNNFYFVRAERDDDFGKATLIETAGGGVEKDEDLVTAIQRELQEELGAKVRRISDYENACCTSSVGECRKIFGADGQPALFGHSIRFFIYLFLLSN